MRHNNPGAVQPDNEVAAPPSPSQVLNVFPWERLPFEIREKIFDNLEDESLCGSYFKWNCSVPALVVALRSPPLFYEHLLQRFADYSSAIEINEWTSFDLSDMSQKELNVIVKAEMELSYIVHLARGEKPNWYTEQFLRASSLREVNLFLNLDNNVVQLDMEQFITEFPYWLEGCKALSKLTVEIPIVNVDESDRRRALDGLMTWIRKKTGVRSQFIEVVGQKWHEMAEAWIWEAAPGNYMNWAQNLAMEWKDQVSYRRWLRSKQWSIFGDRSYEQLGSRDGQFWWRMSGRLRSEMPNETLELG